MTTSTTQIQTPDGPCTTEVVVPPGSGPWPAVIVFFDGAGLRPARGSPRIAATAAFHPGGLVTDQPDSPHTRVKTIKSRVYLAPAIGDLPPEAETKLRAELESGYLRYEIEQYDAKHGYAVDDSDVYDRGAAERHYAALTRLYGETLRD